MGLTRYNAQYSCRCCLDHVHLQEDPDRRHPVRLLYLPTDGLADYCEPFEIRVLVTAVGIQRIWELGELGVGTKSIAIITTGCSLSFYYCGINAGH
jgi:hypothetical protein